MSNLCSVSKASGEQPPELSVEAFALLVRRNWRCNIRALRNVLVQAAMRADSHHLGHQHIEDLLGETNGARIGVAGDPAYTEITPTAPPKEQVSRGLVRPLALQVAELEEASITVALSQYRGNGAAAARLLAISRGKLYWRLQAMHHTHPVV